MLLYNSSNLNLGLRITLKDDFTGPAHRIKSSFKALKDEKRLFDENVRAGRNMYTALATAGATATLGLSRAYAKGAKFDFIMRGVAAASEATSEQFKELKKQANALGGTSMFKPSEVSGAMEMLAKAGLEANDVLAATAPIINLASASMEDLSTSTDIAIGTMYQFGYKAKDLGYISDVLTQAALKSNIGVKDIGESLKYASATLVDMGQSLETALALTMTLGNAGIKGSMAGVSMENMYRYMALGLGQFRKAGRSSAWEAAGLDPKNLVDARGNLVPIVDILKELHRGLSKFGDVDKQNLLYLIFGVRGKRGPSKFLQDLDQVTRNMEILKNSGGKAAAQAQFMMDGPEGAIRRLIASLESLSNAFAETMAPIVIPIMKVLTSFFKGISWFVNSPIGGVIVRMGVGLLIMKTVVWGLRAAVFALTQSLTLMGGTILGVRNAWVGSIAQMKAATLQLVGVTTLAGVGGKRPMAPAYVGTGSRLRQTVTGRYYKNSPGGGSRFVSKAVGDRYVAMYGARTYTGALRLGGIMANVGRGLLGFLGGPVGLAITAGLAFLPMIFNALNKNTEALQSNEESQKEATQQHRRYLSYLTNEFTGSEIGGTYVRRLYEENGYGAGDNTDFILARRLKEYMDSPSAFGSPTKPFYDYSSPGELRIYVDGKLTDKIKTQLNKEINASLQFSL